MRRLLAGGLGCSLAWLATSAAAGEKPGLPPQPRPAAVARSASAVAAPAAGISLGRPQPLSDYAEPQRLPIPANTGIELASYRTETPTVARTIRPGSAAPPAFGVPQPVPAHEVQLTRPPTVEAGTFAAGTPEFTELSSGFATGAVALAAPQPMVRTAAVVMPAQFSDAAPREVMEGEFIDGMDGFGAPSSLYFVGEYLLWWIKSPQFPVLVTTGSTAPGTQGRLGRPGTSVLFGGSTVDYGAFSGGRFTVGYWCDPEQKFGIEASYFFLGQRAINFSADSSQFPVLARPFFDINNGREDAQLTTFPGRATGSVVVNAPSRLWGADVNMRCSQCCWGSRLDWLAGVRYLDLGEGLSILEDIQVDPNFVPPPPTNIQPGDRGIVSDVFNTHNQFFGGQVGFDWEKRWGPWVLNVRSKVAVGVTHQVIDIQGFQVLRHTNGTQQTFLGGFLALPSNIGRVERNRFSVIPEVNINIGYQVTESLQVFVGYSFLYWSNVVRPGDQIDRVLDQNQIPNFPPAPPAPQRRPLVPFKESSFWAQGLNAGLEYRY